MSDSTQHGPTPERLDSAAGAPLADDSGARGRGGRRGLVLGGGVAVLALGAGAAWAWTAFFGQGAQPAQALPEDTLAYLSVDLDPSGQQKLEFKEMAERFPAIEQELGLDTDDDLRRTLFESAQEDGICPDVDYARDVEPWLGNRAAVAAVPGEGEMPDPVVVLQVSDAGAAEDGLRTLVDCAATDSGEDLGGYAVSGEWVVLAGTEAIASAVVDDASGGSLEDHDEFGEMVGAAGDPGFMTMYVAPAAGAAFLDGLAGAGGLAMLGDPAAEEQMREGFAEFPGLGGSMRFADGDVELEVVTGELAEDLATLTDTDRGDDAVATLPEDTAFALGAGLEDGWLGEYLEQLRPVIEEDSGLTYEEALAQFEAETGLAVPEDIEALLGESFALAVGPDIRPELFFAEGPTSLPIGIKVQGDPAEIEAVLEKIRAQLPPQVGGFLLSESEGDHVVVGPNQVWLDRIVGDGGLGDGDAYQQVVEAADDAAGVLFVNFDAGDWLIGLAGSEDDQEAVENLAPLEAFGISTWVEDGRSHVTARLTTED